MKDTKNQLTLNKFTKVFGGSGKEDDLLYVEEAQHDEKIRSKARAICKL